MSEAKICVFAGHRRLAHDIADEVREEIRRLITEDGVCEFWCGGMGEFDRLCAQIVRSLKREFPDIRLALILPALSASAMHMEAKAAAYDEIIVCDASDGAHFKRAIPLRNRFMAQQCSVMLAYLQRDHGGAYDSARWAIKNKKPLRFIREKPEITQRLHHACTHSAKMISSRRR